MFPGEVILDSFPAIPHRQEELVQSLLIPVSHCSSYSLGNLSILGDYGLKRIPCAAPGQQKFIFDDTDIQTNRCLSLASPLSNALPAQTAHFLRKDLNFISF